MSDAILTRFGELNTWRQGDRRAPDKPLLVLCALVALPADARIVLYWC
jgi:hypothetical protein